VRRALGLGDHELATDELDGLVLVEHAQLDEAVVLGAAEAARPRLVARHRRHRNDGLVTGQRCRIDTGLPAGADLG
jgi:hypothetical protein